MCNKENTIGLATLLLELGVDLKTDVEISVNCIPSVVDAYAVVSCAWTLAKCKVPIPAVVIGDRLSIVLQCTPKYLKGVAIDVDMQFDADLCLSRTDIVFRGSAPALSKYVHLHSQIRNGILFEDVDSAMLTTTPILLAPFTAWLFQFVFNSEYDEDFVRMMLLDGEHVKGHHPILVNGQHYADLADQQSWCIDNHNTPDLLTLAAILFHRQAPEQGTINFMFEEGKKGSHPVLAIDVQD